MTDYLEVYRKQSYRCLNKRVDFPNTPLFQHTQEVVRCVNTAHAGVRCVKVTGDVCVPAGETTWRVHAQEARRAAFGASSVAGEVQVAEPGYEQPRYEPCTLHILRDEGEVHLECSALGGKLLRFRRLAPTEPLFVDVFAGGRLHTEEHCREELRRMGVVRGELSSFLEPVGTRSVLSRMARNLSNAHGQQQQGSEDDERAAMWSFVADELGADQ